MRLRRYALMSLRVARAESPAVHRESSEVIGIAGGFDTDAGGQRQTEVTYEGEMLCWRYGRRVSAEFDRG